MLTRRIASVSCGGIILAVVLACNPTDPPDLFRLVAEGVPGGSLLSVWPDRAADATPHGFVAGGYVGVPHEMLPDGRVGRLVEYTGREFRSVCFSDEVLWWVTAARDPSSGALSVYAAGEGGRVLRRRGDACEVLDTSALREASGMPTFYGAVALGPDDVWLVGGSASPSGPKGVVVHFDGRAFTRAVVPEPARRADLFKIDRAPDGALVVVGAGDTVLERPAASADFVAVDAPGRSLDNRLFTVSCAPSATGLIENVECVAVGGAGTGMVLTRVGGRWQSRSSLGGRSVDDLPGLNGVTVVPGVGAYVVGVNGFTMHTTYGRTFSPAMALTSASLHAVSGEASHVVAVGGELSVASPTQRGVVLVRSTLVEGSYRFDGVEYPAVGDLRTSLGGSGQGGGIPYSMVEEGSACSTAGRSTDLCVSGTSCVAGADPAWGVCRPLGDFDGGARDASSSEAGAEAGAAAIDAGLVGDAGAVDS